MGAKTKIKQSRLSSRIDQIYHGRCLLNILYKSDGIPQKESRNAWSLTWVELLGKTKDMHETCLIMLSLHRKYLIDLASTTFSPHNSPCIASVG